jgi:hypothetical protein
VSLPSLLLGGGWWINSSVALCTVALNRSKRGYVKGEPEPGRKRARPVGPGPFWLGLALFFAGELLVSSTTLSQLHVGPWHQFLRGLDRSPYCASFNIFRPGPRSFLPSQIGPWTSWSHAHLVSWLVPGFMTFSQSARWTLPGSPHLGV